MPINSSDWHAWIDEMPPPPNHFHVTGKVLVPNPGVEPTLKPAVPQGINPVIILLDLTLTQKPGNWTQNETWAVVKYDRTLAAGAPLYKQAQIKSSGQPVVTLPVEITRA